MFISTCVLVVYLACINSHKETPYFDDAMLYIEYSCALYFTWCICVYNCNCKFIGLKRLAFVQHVGI